MAPQSRHFNAELFNWACITTKFASETTNALHPTTIVRSLDRCLIEPSKKASRTVMSSLTSLETPP
jgi:hypothetical protein